MKNLRTHITRFLMVAAALICGYFRCSRRFESGNIARLNRALLPANVRNLDRFAQALVGPEPIR
jgi:hypothetical protein